jgi:Coenzyme PQQ synthesis protein D (PqqD)
VLTREDILAASPLRAAGAVLERQEGGGARVKIPVSARWPFRVPRGTVKTFELDEMGLWVWDACDGQRTLLEVITKFAEHYRLSVREAEVATTKFLQTLGSRRLISLEQKK